MRLDTPDKGTEGVARYSHLHGFLPRLGFFVGHEDRIPVDFHEVLALIAPRPVLVLAPELDRDSTLADVKLAVERARAIYRLQGKPDNLTLHAPFDYNRLSLPSQNWALDWMRKTLP